MSPMPVPDETAELAGRLRLVGHPPRAPAAADGRQRPLPHPGRGAGHGVLRRDRSRSVSWPSSSGCRHRRSPRSSGSCTRRASSRSSPTPSDRRFVRVTPHSRGRGAARAHSGSQDRLARPPAAGALPGRARAAGRHHRRAGASSRAGGPSDDPRPRLRHRHLPLAPPPQLPPLLRRPDHQPDRHLDADGGHRAARARHHRQRHRRRPGDGRAVPAHPRAGRLGRRARRPARPPPPAHGDERHRCRGRAGVRGARADRRGRAVVDLPPHLRGRHRHRPREPDPARLRDRPGR